MECKVEESWDASAKIDGLNRNIVECKEGNTRYKVRWLLSLNRNIVECKVLPHDTRYVSWPCLNRNIVECKDNRKWKICYQQRV